MKFTLSWLKDFLETDASLETIGETLTALGLEVEEITRPGEALVAFTIAEIRRAEKHPDADKLQVCRVFDGAQELQIVCGAPNARPGLKVVLAPVGTVMPLDAGFTIKKSKIRGIESAGMLCSARELGLGEDHDGIMELPEDAPVGEAFAPYAGLDDPVIEIAITPNRGDCLGVYGIARDLAAAGLGTLKAPEIPQVRSHHSSSIAVTTEAPACPWFLGRTITGVTNADSPEWMQRRLKAIGLKPISALVDITNYLSYTFARPLHVFDADRLSGDLVVRSANPGETLKALDEHTYTLAQGMTVIADDSGPQALGGIIGGLESGCTRETKNVFLEVAWFDPVNIAETGRALSILTDARARFERTVDPGFMREAMAIATGMIQDLCGGEPSEEVEAGREPDAEREVPFDPDRVRQLTGMDLSLECCKDILERLGCDVSLNLKELDDNTRHGIWNVTVPSYRPDVEGEADLVEEIARIHGYRHLPEATLPSAEYPAASGPTPLQQRLRTARHLLAARGMQEVRSFAFVPNAQAVLFESGHTPLTLKNPISAELDTMRPSLLPNLLEAARRNADRGYSDLALYEVGTQFEGERAGLQQSAAAGIRSGLAVVKHVHGEARPVDTFHAKADALAVLGAFGLTTETLQIRMDAPGWYHPGRAGSLCLGPKQVLGWFGELHPRVLKALDIEGPVCGFEILLEALPRPKARRASARAPLKASDYQAVHRDFAFLVRREVSAAAILRTVRGAEKHLIEDITLFDVYTGPGVEAALKSVAIRVTLRAPDRTLTEQEIEEVCAGIIHAMSRDHEARIRGKAAV